MTNRSAGRAADAAHERRQQWIKVLACAGPLLSDYSEELRRIEHRFIRPAEVGMVMVRGRIGASGAPFNLGEMTVTRCVVQLVDGRHGHSYVAGRSRQQAELAALADAHLQGDSHAHWIKNLIEPLQRLHAAQLAAREAESAATKVEFVTMVRGEDE